MNTITPSRAELSRRIEELTIRLNAVTKLAVNMARLCAAHEYSLVGSSGFLYTPAKNGPQLGTDEAFQDTGVVNNATEKFRLISTPRILAWYPRGFAL